MLSEYEADGGSRPARLLLSKALPIAEQIVATLRAHPAAHRVEVAGSLRRLADTVKDLDIIATSDDPPALARALAELDVVESVASSGDVGARIMTHAGLKVDLKVVEPDQFGNVLQHFTGSKAHNVALRESVVRRGLHVSEYGVLDDATGETLRCATEEEVYAALGLAWIPPELREGRGELEAALTQRAPAADRARRHPRRPALPHDALGRQELARGDGRGGAGARIPVPRDHRPLGVARVRRPRQRRRSSSARSSASASSTRAWTASGS